MQTPDLNPLRASDQARFLRDYWQKRPLLVRQALPGIESPLSAGELAGLACEEGVNARLVLETVHPPPSHWSVEYAPFDETRFSRLPEGHWSLLVSDVEKHVDAAHGLIDRFRFIPDWRIDDLMISFAPPGGSVGAHTDAYDVFLIQLEGQREWQISTDFDPALLEDCPLRILEHFEAQHRWLLEPGDMLYLPPNVAHHGIARTPCMTASVGFRAPAVADMIQDYVTCLASRIDETLRYTDADLPLQEDPAQITPFTVEKVKTLLARHLRIDDESIGHWLGEYGSDNKTDMVMENPVRFDDLDAFRKHIERHGLFKSPASRFLFRHGESQTTLFVDGQSYAVEHRFAQWLCRQPAGEHSDLLKAPGMPRPVDADRHWRTLFELYRNGALGSHAH